MKYTFLIPNEIFMINKYTYYTWDSKVLYEYQKIFCPKYRRRNISENKLVYGS